MTTSSPQHTGPVAAPPEHHRLLKLTLISAGLYLFYDIVTLIAAVTSTRIFHELLGVSTEEARAGTSAENEVRNMVLTSLVLLVGAMVLYDLIYTGLKKGRDWSRLLGIALAIVSIIGMAFASFSLLNNVNQLSLFLEPHQSQPFGVPITLSAIGISISIAVLVVDILWLVTAFKKPVARWFAQQP